MLPTSSKLSLATWQRGSGLTVKGLGCLGFRIMHLALLRSGSAVPPWVCQLLYPIDASPLECCDAQVAMWAHVQPWPQVSAGGRFASHAQWSLAVKRRTGHPSSQIERLLAELTSTHVSAACRGCPGAAAAWLLGTLLTSLVARVHRI